MSEFVIEANNLTHYYANKRALNNMTLRVPVNGISAIVGSNGAGKSTLFRILLGLLKPTFGQCKILGFDSQELTANERAKIGYVNEEHSLPSWMKVGALIAMQKDHYPDWNDSIYQEAIANFNVSAQQTIAELSRGERAGVNLALAMAQQPKVLILDEPTQGLDVVAKRSFLESLLFTQEHNDCSIIYCSHVMEEVERVAEFLIVMEQGEIKNQSSPDDFVARVDYWIAEYANNPPRQEQIPGLLQQRFIDGQYHYTVLDQKEGFAEFLKSQGTLSQYKVAVNLDRAVNGFLAKNHASLSNKCDIQMANSK